MKKWRVKWIFSKKLRLVKLYIDPKKGSTLNLYKNVSAHNQSSRTLHPQGKLLFVITAVISYVGWCAWSPWKPNHNQIICSTDEDEFKASDYYYVPTKTPKLPLLLPTRKESMPSQEPLWANKNRPTGPLYTRHQFSLANPRWMSQTHGPGWPVYTVTFT